MPEKSYHLAKHIVENGLNPTTLVAVFETEDGHQIVKDGNRRVTVLKVLSDPSIIEQPEIRSKYESLSKMFNKDDYRTIPCIVFDNEEESDTWVENNHVPSPTGIGMERWDPQMKERFKKDHGKGSDEYELYEIALKEANIDADRLNYSTFERIVGSKKFKDLIGFKRTEKTLQFSITANSLKSLLTDIALDISDPNREDAINSRNINDKEQIETYLMKKGVTLDSSECSSITLEDTSVPRKKGKKAESGTKERQIGLIPKDTGWSIDNKRINDIYIELQDISLQKHPNTVSVLFRAFVEMSIKKYIADNNLETEKSLAERILAVATHLEKMKESHPMSSQPYRWSANVAMKTESILRLN